MDFVRCTQPRCGRPIECTPEREELWDWETDKYGGPSYTCDVCAERIRAEVRAAIDATSKNADGSYNLDDVLKRLYPLPTKPRA